MHVGSEGGDDDPLVAVAELPVKALRHNVFAGGVALTLHVGGICQQGQYALIAQFAEPGQIDHAVLGGGVDLEVAGEDYGAHRRPDGQGAGIGDGMVDVDEFHSKATGLHGIAGLVGHQLDLVGQTVLFQLQLDETVGHGSAMDGGVDLPHGVGDGTDMVFVAVGDEEAPELLLVGHEIGKVGDHQIHAVHVLLREAYAAVDDDHILAVFQHGAVLADLIQTAKRDNFQFFSQINTPFRMLILVLEQQKQATASQRSGPESPSPGANACVNV